MPTSLFLITSQMKCNLCGTESTIAALAMLNPDDPELAAEYAGGEDDGFLLTHLDEIPSDVLAKIHTQIARDFDRQVAELQIRAAQLNRCTQKTMLMA